MRATVEQGHYQHEYIIGFPDAEGEMEVSSLVVSLELDPHDSRITVEYQGDYGCTCKGLGCPKCNSELAALARGENPWAHHTSGNDSLE